MKIDDVFSDKSILERKHDISGEELKNMSMKELIPLILFLYIFKDVLLNEEILNAEQSVEKMNFKYKSAGSICIDHSKMEYVENESNCE